MLLFVELTETPFVPAPKTAWMAAASLLSFIGVDVPCALR